MECKSYNLLSIGKFSLTLFLNNTGDSLQLMWKPYWLTIGYFWDFQFGLYGCPETEENPGHSTLYLGFIYISLLVCSK